MITFRKRAILGLTLVSLATLLILVFCILTSDDREMTKRLKVSRIAMEKFRNEFNDPIAPWTSPPKITDQKGASYSSNQTFYVSGIPQSHFELLSDYMQKLAERYFPEGLILRNGTRIT
jgi:hypothetical protein